MSEARGGNRGARPAGSAFERWALPRVEGPLATRAREERSNAGGDSRQDSARGYEAGMARAQAEMQSGLQELDARVRRLESVLQHLAQPLRVLDAEVEKELLQLALAIGAQLARRELRADPGQVVALLRECLDQLPAAAREVRVHLHPEDAALVRERLAMPAEARAWTMVDDPTLSRGGCRVRSDTSHIDARFESRLNAVIASALGDQRAPERSAAAGTDPTASESPE
jgi:flagellar assembly protein FliH